MSQKSNWPAKIVTHLKKHPDVRFTLQEIADAVSVDGRSVRPSYVNVVLRHRPAEAILREGEKIVTVDNPLRFYWTDKGNQDEVAEAEASDTAGGGQLPPEKDLYPLLAEFLWSGFARRIYTKRISEARAGNRQGPGGNIWLYPDLVGMEDLTSDWEGVIKGLVTSYPDKKVKLWSFEVKILLNSTKVVREAFFQTVSNSSWANFAYLVATEIRGKETMRELRMLSTLHGIGLIKLDTESPADSQILIPARERDDVDWETCNRIARENGDYRKFIEAVRVFVKSDNPESQAWYSPKDWGGDE